MTMCYRDGLRDAPRQFTDIEIVGEAGTTRATVAAALALQPNVLITELRMPGGDGIEVIGEIRLAAERRRCSC